MPFMIVHHKAADGKAEEWCVHTQADDGDPKGSSHGCHPTREQAVQQLRALYANVPEARKATLTTAAGTLTQYDRPAQTMPQDGPRWAVRQQGDQYCVFRPDGPDPVKCFPTEEAARAYAATCAGMEAGDMGMKVDVPDLLIGFGDAVKALPAGKIGGRVVRFTHAEDYDVTGEFFDAGTDFGLELPAKVGLYYHHGFDPTLGKRRLGHAEVKADEDGLWFEAQLDLADRYQARMYQLAQAGKLGASSGAVKHLVEKEAAGKAARLTSWPLGEVSLTPSPAMPGNGVMALKAWLDSAPTFDTLSAEMPALKASFAEEMEQFLDRGDDIISQLEKFAAMPLKAGKPQFSASRLERMQRMYLLIRDLLREGGGTQPTEETEEVPGTGAASADPGAVGTAAAGPLDGPALESQFLATLARLNGVSVDAAAPVAA